MPVYLERLGELAKRLTPGQGEDVLHSVSPELVYAVIIENDRPENQPALCVHISSACVLAYPGNKTPAGGKGFLRFVFACYDKGVRQSRSGGIA